MVLVLISPDLPHLCRELSAQSTFRVLGDPDYWHVPDPGAQFHVIASRLLTSGTRWNDLCVEVTEGHGLGALDAQAPPAVPRSGGNLCLGSLVTVPGLHWKAPLQAVFTFDGLHSILILKEKIEERQLLPQARPWGENFRVHSFSK